MKPVILNIEVTKIVVIQRPNFMDTINIHTTLPGAIWPFDETPTLHMCAGYQMGVEYVRTHFGIEPEVIG